MPMEAETTHFVYKLRLVVVVVVEIEIEKLCGNRVEYKCD
jgi:hypothetical protein